MSLYGIVSFISWFIRNNYLPDPFGPVGILFNTLIESLLHYSTFKTVGLFYRRGSFPSFGSLLYLVFYIIHNGLLYEAIKFNLSIFWIIIMILIYVYLLRSLYKIIHNY